MPADSGGRCRPLRHFGEISAIHKNIASKWKIGDGCGLAVCLSLIPMRQSTHAPAPRARSGGAASRAVAPMRAVPPARVRLGKDLIILYPVASKAFGSVTSKRMFLSAKSITWVSLALKGSPPSTSISACASFSEMKAKAVCGGRTG